MKNKNGFKGFSNEVNPAETAWEMFEKTGNLSYYLLYKKLK